MKCRQLTSIVLLAVAMTLLTACSSIVPIAGSDSDIEKLQKEVKQLRQQITELQRTVRKMNAPQARKESAPKEVLLGNSPVIGHKKAKIAIIEFSDYECPYCKRFHATTYERLKQKFVDTGKVKYVYRDFPLNFHRNAVSAAVAARCAGKQGAYWAMQRKLFQRRAGLSNDLYIQSAKGMKLNMTTYKKCLKSVRQSQAVNQDLAYGKSLRVSGTPAFFIGRVRGNKIVDVTRITGAQPYSVFDSAIRLALDSVNTKAAKNQGRQLRK